MLSWIAPTMKSMPQVSLVASQTSNSSTKPLPNRNAAQQYLQNMLREIENSTVHGNDADGCRILLLLLQTDTYSALKEFEKLNLLCRREWNALNKLGVDRLGIYNLAEQVYDDQVCNYGAIYVVNEYYATRKHFIIASVKAALTYKSIFWYTFNEYEDNGLKYGVSCYGLFRAFIDLHLISFGCDIVQKLHFHLETQRADGSARYNDVGILKYPLLVYILYRTTKTPAKLITIGRNLFNSFRRSISSKTCRPRLTKLALEELELDGFRMQEIATMQMHVS